MAPPLVNSTIHKHTSHATDARCGGCMFVGPHHAVLQGVPKTLDPPLRLEDLDYRMGNRERNERMADLRRGLMVLEILGDHPVRIVCGQRSRTGPCTQPPAAPPSSRGCTEA